MEVNDRNSSTNSSYRNRRRRLETPIGAVAAWRNDYLGWFRRRSGSASGFSQVRSWQITTSIRLRSTLGCPSGQSQPSRLEISSCRHLFIHVTQSPPSIYSASINCLSTRSRYTPYRLRLSNMRCAFLCVPLFFVSAKLCIPNGDFFQHSDQEKNTQKTMTGGLYRPEQGTGRYRNRSTATNKEGK